MAEKQKIMVFDCECMYKKALSLTTNEIDATDLYNEIMDLFDKNFKGVVLYTNNFLNYYTTH